jgi:hypothetical protein
MDEVEQLQTFSGRQGAQNVCGKSVCFGNIVLSLSCCISRRMNSAPYSPHLKVNIRKFLTLARSVGMFSASLITK